ncbi:MAG: Uma2 family endonuclease [Thioploca sp.]|nr:Uma2 family endonuclease [Thioploca sp.]
MTSKQTGSADLTTKYQLYERLGIKEYFLFDPLGEYLQPNLQGFTLVKRHYQALSLSVEGELISWELGLILRSQGDLLRLVDSYTGQMLATSCESVRRTELAKQQALLEKERTRVETQRANSETQRANLAEAKIIELQQELERLRRKKS